MSKKQMLALIIFATALLAALPGCGFLSSGDAVQLDEDPWGYIVIPENGRAKIGVAMAITGPYSRLGDGVRNSVGMALRDIKPKGGLLFELAVEDDMCQRDRAYLVARAMVEEPTLVGVVGHMCGEATMAAIPVYTEAKTVMLTPASTAPSVTKTGSPLVFRTSWNDLAQARRAAEYASKSLGLKTAAIVYDTTTYGASLSEEFQRSFQAEGGAVVASRQLPYVLDAPFDDIVEALRSAAPALIYFAGSGKAGAAVLKGVRDAGIRSPFMGPDSFQDQTSFLDEAGPIAEGTYVTFLRFQLNPRYREWKPRYEAIYKTTMPDFNFNPQAYDAASILIESVQKVAVKQKDGSFRIGRKALADTIRGADYDGLTGRISFDQSGDRTEVVAEVARVVRGLIRSVG